jgi:hypothetical protein
MYFFLLTFTNNCCNPGLALLIAILSLKAPVDDSWEWEEQSLHSGWQQRSNEWNGNNLDHYWIRGIERSLTNCMTTLNYIIILAATPVDLS